MVMAKIIPILLIILILVLLFKPCATSGYQETMVQGMNLKIMSSQGEGVVGEL